MHDVDPAIEVAADFAERRRGKLNVQLWATGLVFVALAGVTISYPVQIYGDGMEYLGMAASIIKDRDLVFDREDVYYTAHWGEPTTLLPFDQNGHLTRINRDGDRVWGTHSFYYPVLLVPFLAVFGVKGAILLNVLLFSGVFLIVARSLSSAEESPWVGISLASALLFCSPLLSYVFWVHTEISLFFSVSASLLALTSGRPILGAVLLGWAAAQKPPLVFVFLLFVGWTLIRHKNYRAFGYATLAMSWVMVPQLYYNVMTFGSLSSLGGFLNLELVSAERVFTFWLGPARGMLWFFPLLVWCVMRSTRPWWWTLMAAGVAMAVSVASCVITVFYTHEVGIRYGVYIYPLFLSLVPRWKSGWVDTGILTISVFLAGGLLLNPLANLASWNVYPHPYVSRTLVDGGLHLHPETIQQSWTRLPREVSADYIDTDGRPRQSTVSLLAKRVRDPEMVVKLYGIPAEGLQENRTVSLEIDGSATVTKPIEERRVTTLYVAAPAEDLHYTTFPNVTAIDGSGQSEVPILRAKLKMPMYITMRGNGKLRWTGMSRPDMPSVEHYLYRVGPYIAGIYPGRSWVLGGMVSDELVKLGLMKNALEPVESADSVGRVEIVEGLGVEGDRSLRLEVVPSEDTAEAIFVTAPIELQYDGVFEPKLEVAGWFRSSGLSAWGIEAAFDTSGADGRAVVASGRSIKVTDWLPFTKRIDVPENANVVQLEILLNGAGGALELDDILVTRWVGPWD